MNRNIFTLACTWITYEGIDSRINVQRDGSKTMLNLKMIVVKIIGLETFFYYLVLHMHMFFMKDS